jgi:hypothetical protein
MKKTITLLGLLLCSCYFAHAQFYKSILPNEAFSDSLAIIVQDFKKNFATIEGRQLPSQGEMDLYRSKVSVPGAVHATICRFHSSEDTTGQLARHHV